MTNREKRDKPYLAKRYEMLIDSFADTISYFGAWEDSLDKTLDETPNSEIKIAYEIRRILNNNTHSDCMLVNDEDIVIDNFDTNMAVFEIMEMLKKRGLIDND